MSREESKKRLEAFRDYLCAGNPIWDVDECREAFSTAIQSLEAWGKVKKDLADLWLEGYSPYPEVMDIIDRNLKEVEE